MNRYITSAAEPLAIFKKFANSILDFRPWPSAILAMIDTEARCIWSFSSKSLANWVFDVIL